MRDFSSTRSLSSDEVDKAIVEIREKVSHRYHYRHHHILRAAWQKGCVKSSLFVHLYHLQEWRLRPTPVVLSHHAVPSRPGSCPFLCSVDKTFSNIERENGSADTYRYESHVSAHFPAQFAHGCSFLIIVLTPWLNVLEITTKSVHLIKVASPSCFCWLILKQTLQFFLFCFFFIPVPYSCPVLHGEHYVGPILAQSTQTRGQWQW